MKQSSVYLSYINKYVLMLGGIFREIYFYIQLYNYIIIIKCTTLTREKILTNNNNILTLRVS